MFVRMNGKRKYKTGLAVVRVAGFVQVCVVIPMEETQLLRSHPN